MGGNRCEGKAKRLGGNEGKEALEKRAERGLTR